MVHLYGILKLLSSFPGETSTKKEEKSSSLCQIEEKSLQVASLEKDVAQLQRLAELNSQSQSLPGEDCKTEQLQVMKNTNINTAEIDINSSLDKQM